MKAYLYAILTVFLILCTASCQESLRKKAQRLADSFSATYADSTSTVKALANVRLDSARIEYIHLSSTHEKVERIQRLAKENQEILASLQQPQYSPVVFEMLKKQLWDTGTAVERLRGEITREERAYDGRVPGWMTFYRFRVLRKDGYMRFYQYMLYFDEDVTRITGLVDMNDSLPVYREIPKQ
ncbi:MAG: hypothetical protein ACOYJE_10200 [Bacteroidaceae bacterium]|jgi:hypothetical protein